MALHVTAVEAELARRRWPAAPLAIVLALALLAGLAVIGIGVAVALVLVRSAPPHYADAVEHFKYGSIGSEPEGGVPYRFWQALPSLYPKVFAPALAAGDGPYAVFGFLYEKDEAGRPRDLPIGVSRRPVRGVDMVWLNCAVCHTGTWRLDAASPRRIVPGMPANNLDLGRFVGFLLGAAADERIAPAGLIRAATAAGAGFGPLERLYWWHGVGPALREGLITRRSRLLPLLDGQPPWGPGRVDTFNPYKVNELGERADALTEEERIGVSDFPSIFLQGPRQGMHLHWDGNNTSLEERNLSAAVGAGVTPATVDHAAIRRVAAWLQDLVPAPSPHWPDPAAVERGRRIYTGRWEPGDWETAPDARSCASCHGYLDAGGRYVFRGAGVERIGMVEPIGAVGTDRRRLDSYTEAFRRRQTEEIFAGTPYRFTHFAKTDGYANQPLDGLWLRAPYLHNGSVPTLADLLEPPERRPKAFVRGIDVLDRNKGGFEAPACDSDAGRAALALGVRRNVCFHTDEAGNGNGGHLYGTGLSAAAKADLLAYLRTF